MTVDQEAELTSLAGRVVERARALGAEVAEASARAGWELSAKVRLGEPELVEEAGTRSIALRVMRESRVALSATSDLSDAGIERCVADAVALLELSQPDDCAGPAPREALASAPFPDLDLLDPAVAAIDAAEALERARTAEAAAMAHDPRLTLSEGATFSRVTGASALVLSSGFSGFQRGSYASLVVSPVVEDADGKKRRGHHWTAARHLSGLEDGAAVGVEAARRTLARLGARPVPTCTAPVIFDPDVARSLLGTLAGCLLGGALWRKASYLVGREGTAVASPLIDIVDDPLLPRGPGSRAFDGEGMPSRRTVVVEKGVLKTYLLDWYSARKLGRASTGSAARSGGSVSSSTSNLILAAGAVPREDIIASTPRGLYVTEMMGFGFNPVTGDFSRGAAGFWIEDGQFVHPVGEVTVSSTLEAMFLGIDAVGSDLSLKTSVAAPTLRVASMTIAGR